MILVDVTGNQFTSHGKRHYDERLVIMQKRMASRYLFQDTAFPLSLSLRRVLQKKFDGTFIEHFTGFKVTSYIDLSNLGCFDLISLTENHMSQNHDFIKLTVF